MNSETAILKKKPLDDAKRKFKRLPLYSSMKKQLDDDSSSEDERKPEDLVCTVSKEVELDVDTETNNLRRLTILMKLILQLPISNYSIKTFITTWKEQCWHHTVPEVC